VIIIDEFGDGRPDQYQRPDAAESQPAFVLTIPGLNLIAEIANPDLFGRRFCAVSNPLALTDFREGFSTRNYISKRFSVKNRSYRKQTTKPPLTGSRIAFKGFSKIAALPRENQPRITAPRAKMNKHSLLLSPRNFIGLQDRDCRSVRLTISVQK